MYISSQLVRISNELKNMMNLVKQKYTLYTKIDILNVTGKPQIDGSVEKYEVHEYTPITGTNLNNRGEIIISIETQDLLTHPSESYLGFKGELVKNADDGLYADADVITLPTMLWCICSTTSNTNFQDKT